MSAAKLLQISNILNTECNRFSDKLIHKLNSLGNVTHVDADRNYLLDNIYKYDVLLIALNNTIDKELIDRATNLRCIVTPTTGHNHIDCVQAKRKGIDIISLRGEFAFLETITATAELTWGLLLSSIRHIPTAHHDVMSFSWDRNKYYGMELKGKTLGIIGLGRLGKMVATYAKAFNMHVLAFDTKSTLDMDNVKITSLDNLLSNSDVISLHLPFNGDTSGIINESIFSKMKNGVVFINTARGELVDEEALISALQAGHVSFAAVDVVANETSLDPSWIKNHRLINYAKNNTNLVITPHIGGVTNESVEQANEFIINKLENYIRM